MERIKKLFRESRDYLAIAGLNFLILTVLMVLWVDRIESLFGFLVLQIELLKIIGVTMLSLLGMRIAIKVFDKKKKYNKSQLLRVSVAVTVFISLFLYIDYSKKVYVNAILKRELRSSLSDKIVVYEGYPHGSYARNLTYHEYKEITNAKWFPMVQEYADSISYGYIYDGFLPDYSFDLSFNLPLEIDFDTLDFKYGKIKIDTFGDIKRIVYSEYVD